MAGCSLLPARLYYLDLMREVEDLLYGEADLLDERQYEQWLELFTDDVRYWMPLRKNVSWHHRTQDSSTEDEVGWVDDDKRTLAARVKQLMTGIHWAEEPISRVSHLVSNIRLNEKVDSLKDGASITVKCHFLVYRNRLDTETDVLVGRRHDTLRRVNGDLKIAARKILIEQSVLMAKNLTVFL